MRRSVPLMLAIALAASACSRASEPAATAKKFTVVEATIPDMQPGHGRRARHLARAGACSTSPASPPTKNASTPRSRSTRKRSTRPTRATASARAGKIRGPLHGIPIALKDNIHTTNMPTTGGALAFDGFVPPYEATLTTNLRDAGAIIIAKTGMTELANWVAGAPTPMPANYNALGGFGFNPYDPRRDPRDGDRSTAARSLATGGSSSGIGTAANFWAGNVGTETSGSILSPSNQNMLAGDQADGRPHQPLRRDSDHRRSGHAGPDGADGDRRRDHARRARRRVARSERSGDAARARRRRTATTRRSSSATASKARASASRARSSTTRCTPPGDKAAARRTERRAAQGDGRGDRRR